MTQYLYLSQPTNPLRFRGKLCWWQTIETYAWGRTPEMFLCWLYHSLGKWPGCDMSSEFASHLRVPLLKTLVAAGKERCCFRAVNAVECWEVRGICWLLPWVWLARRTAWCRVNVVVNPPQGEKYCKALWLKGVSACYLRPVMSECNVSVLW